MTKINSRKKQLLMSITEKKWEKVKKNESGKNKFVSRDVGNCTGYNTLDISLDPS